MALIVGHIFFGVNSAYRAFVNTHSAINALTGVNSQKIGTFHEAVHGTYVNAIGIFALDAGFCDNMGHIGISFSWIKKSPF
jgi:hypothetical protein